MPQPNGYVLWEGPSLLTGDPIVVVSTGHHKTSQNKKTGHMIQVWILCKNNSPLASIKNGQDQAICGSCRHGPGATGKRSCYVEVGRAPSAVWKAWGRGRYPQVEAGAFKGRLVRLGAYGDPAAVPLQVWERICAEAAAWTGYTHQWRTAGAGLNRFCMASCDSELERAEAKLRGFRVFRVSTSKDYARLKGESACPASVEAGNKLQCDTCLACSGIATGQRSDVVIKVHGAVGAVRAFDLAA